MKNRVCCGRKFRACQDSRVQYRLPACLPSSGAGRMNHTTHSSSSFSSCSKYKVIQKIRAAAAAVSSVLESRELVIKMPRLVRRENKVALHELFFRQIEITRRPSQQPKWQRQPRMKPDEGGLARLIVSILSNSERGLRARRLGSIRRRGRPSRSSGDGVDKAYPYKAGEKSKSL